MQSVEVTVNGVLLPKWFVICLIVFAVMAGISGAHANLRAKSLEVENAIQDLKIEDLGEEINELKYQCK